MKKYDFGIVGLWHGLNYGSLLTYYSLQSYLKELNKSVLMIECPLSKNHYENKEDYHARKFTNNHYEISKFRYISQLKELNEECDGFILGSDQVFNPGICSRFKNTFFLSFADETKKKIAYASSFGHQDFKIKGLQKLKYNYFFNKFDGISVRESSGLTILKERLNFKNGVQVVDPIFFQLKNKFKELIEEVEPIKEKNYILTYILDPTTEKKELIKKTSSYLNRKFFNILDGFTNKYEDNYNLMNLENTLPPIMVQEVLAYYKNADFIITDSFHGTCLAIIFEKPFVAIINEKRGITRFESLLKRLNLMDRVFYDVQTAISKINKLNDIDYNKVYEILNADISFSQNWLKEKINEEKRIKYETIKDKLLIKFFDCDFLTYKYFKLFKAQISKLISSKRKKEHYDAKILKIKEEINLYKLDLNKYKRN